MSESVKIRVSRETRKALLDIGRKGQSYDAVLVRLIAHYARTRHIDLSRTVQDNPDIEKKVRE